MVRQLINRYFQSLFGLLVLCSIATGQVVEEQEDWVDCQLSMHYLFYAKSNFRPPEDFVGNFDPTVDVPQPQTFYFLGGAGDWVDLRATPSKTTRSVHYVGPRKLRIFTQAPSQDSLEIPPPIGEIEIPAAAKSLLLVFQKAGNAYSFFLVDSSVEKLRPGEASITNFFDGPVVFTEATEKSRISLLPGETKRIDFKAGRSRQINLLGAVRGEEDQWELFYSNRFSIDSRTRAVFLVSKGNDGRPAVRIIPLR